jgi:hypothetical protein
MAKISALEKFFKTHRRSCTVHTYSGDRHCSCGRDEAWQEILRLQTLAQPNTVLQADKSHKPARKTESSQLGLPL